jgi:hypothetical protein
MPALKKKTLTAASSPVAEYRGKQTKTGNSSGFRFEGALFRSHPEFNGAVKAHVIAPGRMLVTAENDKQEKTDPVLESFLAFLGQDIASNPEKVQPLSTARARRIARLTKGVAVSVDEDLGSESLL